MGLFDRLFGGRFSQPAPDETNVSDRDIMKGNGSVPPPCHE